MPLTELQVSERLRSRAVRLGSREILVSRLADSDQRADLTEPPNCGGIGRLRHYRRASAPGWPENPLPIDPAQRALGLGTSDELRTQLFQNAACNWRCWYCYVPFPLLAADESRAEWVTSTELVRRYRAVPGRPSVLVLSGGQPDLVPEWVPWTIEALEQTGNSDVYLWSDDNLSSDFFWRYLSPSQIDLTTSYAKYGRVGCFKGFDAASFAFNTGAPADQFEMQFERFARLMATGIDLYAYVTLTTPIAIGVRDGVRRFVDALQGISPYLPLRTVPLRIQEFGPTKRRLTAARGSALANQWVAVEAWQAELEERFTPEWRERNIADIPLSASQ